MKALSIRQPWADAILYGGKRVENRNWAGSKFRGRCLIHAAKGCTHEEHQEARVFMRQRGIAWRPPPISELRRGFLIGVAEVVGVVGVGGVGSQDPYWTGGFALELDHVQPLREPIPYKGKRGFFEVPDELVRLAMGEE